MASESVAQSALPEELAGIRAISEISDIPPPPGLMLPPPGILLSPIGSFTHSQSASESSARVTASTLPDKVAIPPPPGLIGVWPLSVPSIGSIHHGSGSCKPCGWFWKEGGCINGSDCYHCHLCPSGAIRAHKKSKRLPVLIRQLEALEVKVDIKEKVHFMEQKEDKKDFEPMRIQLPDLFEHYSFDDIDESTVEGSSSDSQSVPGSPASVVMEKTLGEETAIPAPPGLMLPPPGVLVPVTPSVGSIHHGSGHCKPCGWFWKAGGCANGSECHHCHLCPMDELSTRRRMKRALVRCQKAQHF